MPPDYEPPEHTGPEEALLALLLTHQAKFVAEREGILKIGMRQGVSRERVEQIMRLALSHESLREMRECFDVTIPKLVELKDPAIPVDDERVSTLSSQLDGILRGTLKTLHGLETAAVFVLAHKGQQVMLTNVPRPLAVAMLDAEIRFAGGDDDDEEPCPATVTS